MNGWVIKQQDPFIMGQVAISTLMQYGPNAANVYWHGSNVSPVTFLNDLINEGWIGHFDVTNDYQVYYDGIGWNTYYQCGFYLSPNTSYGSDIRTATIGELATLLAYVPAWHYTQFQSYADG